MKASISTSPLVVEPLEPRLLLNASIAGSVFFDLNGNGAWEPGEPGLPARTVYLDLEDSGTLDEGDPYTSTSWTGEYEFSGLDPGTYSVRLAPRDGWSATQPSSNGGWTVTVESGESAAGKNFGSYTPPVLIASEWNATEWTQQVKTVEPDTGTVTILGELGDLEGWFGRSVLDPAHSALYVSGLSADGTTKLYTFDVDLGSLVIEQPLGHNDMHLAGIDRYGHIIGLEWDAAAGTHNVLRIDPYLAGHEELGTVDGMHSWRGQSALDPDADLLYVIGSPDDVAWDLYTFDLAAGAVVAQLPISEPEMVLAGVDATGDLIGLAWNPAEAAQQVFRIDPESAEAIAFAQVGDLAVWHRQTVLDPANDLLYVAGSSEDGPPTLYTIDLAVGSVIVQSALPTGFDAFVNHQTRIEYPGMPRVMHQGMSLPLWEEPIDQELLLGSIADLAELGATRVAVNVFWFQDDLDSVVIEPRPDKWTALDSTVETAIDLIHAHGMQVMLKPNVDVIAGGWRGQIEGTDAWFTSPAGYQSFVNHFADMAQAKGVEIFCVGTELIQTTDNVAMWRNTIEGIRDRFDGDLTYAANWHWDRATDADITWWDDLDYIGIDAYYPLTEKLDPTVEELRAAWQPHIANIESWYAGLSAAERKPILFTEIGYRSWDGANRIPWDLSDKDGTNIDEQEQADCYTAVFEELWRQRGWLRGLYWWNWEVDPEGEVPNWYPIQGKPAEAVVAEYYGGA